MSERAPARPRRTQPRLYQAVVLGAHQVSATLRRITVTAPELRDYTTVGWDEYLGLIFPRSADSTLLLPHLAPDAAPAGTIRQRIAALPEAVRPELRWYTVRQHRPATGEIDIDFVVHGDAGPGTRFARRARPGDFVGIQESAALYNPPANASTQLLVGDESSLPAIARILEHIQPKVAPTVFIETADPGDRIELAAAVQWVARTDRPGTALLAAIRAAALPGRFDYAWLCGEREAVQRVRRHLADERGVQKSRITFSGYWKLGEPRR